MRPLLLLLALTGCLAAMAQDFPNNSWTGLRMENIRSAGNLSNVSVVGDRIYFSNAGLLFSAPLSDAAVADVDTFYTRVDGEMNYIVAGPDGLYYTKHAGRRTLLCQIVTDKRGRQIGVPVHLPRFKGNVVHPTFSPDGSLMVFSSDAEGGQGGFDLWYSQRISGQWSTPVNLGSNVNTPGHEFSPALWGEYLFFSSNRDQAEDFDLYCTRLVSTQHVHDSMGFAFPIGLAPVQRMPAPLSWKGNDFGIAFASDCAFFVSHREGDPCDRLYKLKGPLQCVAYEGSTAPDATLRVFAPDGKQLLHAAYADCTGRFRLYLPAGQRFVVETSAPGYLSMREDFDTRPSSDEVLLSAWGFNPELQSFSTKTSHPFQAQNLFGSESGSDLTPEGITELEPIIRFARENPQLSLTVTAVYNRHKNDSYCTLLNSARLQTLLRHLSRQGLNASQVDTRNTVGLFRRPDGSTLDNVILFRFD